MTEHDLHVIEARAGAALPGPWFVSPDDPSLVQANDASDPPGEPPWEVAGCLRECGYDFDRAEANAAFIAAARGDVPALVRECLALMGVFRDRIQDEAALAEAYRKGAEDFKRRALEALDRLTGAQRKGAAQRVVRDLKAEG